MAKPNFGEAPSVRKTVDSDLSTEAREIPVKSNQNAVLNGALKMPWLQAVREQMNQVPEIADDEKVLYGQRLPPKFAKELEKVRAEYRKKKVEEDIVLPKVIISENEPKPRKKTESEIRLEQIERNREGERKAAEEFAKRNPAEAAARRAEAKARAEKSYARVDFGLTEEQKAALSGNMVAPEISLFERYKKGSIAFDDMTEAEKKELQRQINAAKRGNG